MSSLRAPMAESLCALNPGLSPVRPAGCRVDASSSIQRIQCALRTAHPHSGPSFPRGKTGYVKTVPLSCSSPRTLVSRGSKPAVLRTNRRLWTSQAGAGSAGLPELPTDSVSTTAAALQPSEASLDQAESGEETEASEESPLSLGSLFALLKDAWYKGVILPLANFGMGKRSIREGGVGLFMISGVVLLALIASWVQGIRVRARSTRYQAIFEFGQACGLAVGTPVRIRGVDVGSVVGVKPSLERIDAVVEILDDNVIIPRNSVIEVNQSGLISETLIDITPQQPMPEPTVGPTHPKCPEEGLIVCERERIKGHQGVSLDELVGICTKLAKEMDSQGVGTMFEAMDKFAALAEEAKPLVEKVNAMASDIKPMLSNLKDGELLKNLERLTGVALEAAEEIKQLNTAMLDSENTHLLKDTVTTLTKTLKHIEGISHDVSTLTGDPSTRGHIKQLIESLSRIVVD